jgi:hypothetical protein
MSLYTREEAARLLRLPVGTLAAYAYRRIGPPFKKVGRRALYPEAALLAWLDAQPTGGGTD